MPECPACHHPDHDPGSCEWCPRCELHTDDALAWVERIEPELIAARVTAALDALAAEVTGMPKSDRRNNDGTWRQDLDRAAVLAAIEKARR